MRTVSPFSGHLQVDAVRYCVALIMLASYTALLQLLTTMISQLPTTHPYQERPGISVVK
jgi:hypothetical protein